MKKSKNDDSRRVSRVEREVQMTIAKFLLSGFRHPLPGLVTVSQVKMPGDLRTAKVYISVLGTPSEKEQVVHTLQNRAFEVQNYIGQELKMRFCPKLTFFPDEATEQVLKIEKILSEIKGEASMTASEIKLQPNLKIISSSSPDEDEN